MGKKVAKGGQKIGSNSPNTGEGKLRAQGTVAKRNATRAFNQAQAELRKAAQVHSGTVGFGIGAGNNEAKSKEGDD